MDMFSVGYKDSSFIMVDKWTSPTQEEIAAFSSNSHGEIRFVEIDGVIFFLLKLGDLAWQDAPFTPHWYDPKPFTLPIPSNNQGYMFQLTLIDAMTGIQRMNRIVGAGSSFSSKLYSVISENYMKPFSMIEYNNKLNRIYQTYATEQIAEMCPEDQCYVIGTRDEHKAAIEYPVDTDIPEELRRWVCYPMDMGISTYISCVPHCLRGRSSNLDDLLVPIPLQYLLDNDYTLIDDGYICVDVEYDDVLGVVLPDKYNF